MREFFKMGHAEQVPLDEFDSSAMEVYYLPMHAVRKEDSTISKLRIVFYLSASTASGTSLNNHLLVGPSVHHPLIDVLLKFRR